MQIAAEVLREISAQILAAAGSSAEEAGKVAARLVDANLHGHDSHGVIRVPQYVGQVKSGALLANQRAEVVAETDTVTVLDGHFGYGQIMGERSIELAIGKARRHGIAMSALRHSAHLGRVGDWPEMAAAAGMASLHFVNATGIPLRVVPHGGRDGRGTTNPIAMGIPCAGCGTRDPRFRDLGDRRGQGQGRAQQGRPDPARALPGRRRRQPHDRPEPPVHRPARQPFAVRRCCQRAQGRRWLMCDLLAGALTGGGCSKPPEGEARFSSSMLSILIAPQAYGDAGAIGAEIERYLGFVKSSRPRQEGGEVLLPGVRSAAPGPSARRPASRSIRPRGTTS